MRKLKFLISIGVLSLSSATAVAQQRSGDGERMLENLDSNGDNSVSFEEFQQREPRAFNRMDSNDDGVLSLQEFKNGRPGPSMRDRGRRGNSADSGDDGRPRREPSEEQRALMVEMRALRASEQFEEINTDGDDVVSHTEYLEMIFLNMDRDGDGILSKGELSPRRQGRPGGPEGRQPRERRGQGDGAPGN